MWNRKWLAGSVLALASGMAAIACGPFFPWQLLDDRAQTLKATPVNSFSFEASHLAPVPNDKLKPVEMVDYAWASQNDSYKQDAARQLGEAEGAGLSKADVALLQAARGAASGAEALAKGKGLPPAVLHYTAGAVAWHKGDTAFARSEFQAVLALPPKDRAIRGVWAAYMLGKVEAANIIAGWEATSSDDRAAAAFRKARDLALKGAADPLGLAVASFGEDARLHLHAAEALLDAGGRTVATPANGQATPDSEAVKFTGSVLPARSADAFREEIRQAIWLYADQAAHGSQNGVQSLRIVAEFLLDRSDRIEAVAAEPAVERLMVAYALRLTANNTYDLGHQSSSYIPNGLSYGTQLSSDRQKTVFDNLVAALQKQKHPAGADRIAALCYEIGDWKCASDFAAKTSSPLSDWVKAKLATQKGDLKSAAEYYAAAVHGFPTDGSLEQDNKKQLIGESGVVALARGDYVDAIAKLWPVSNTYWSDVAYLAERVLTVDELKTFVDANVPPGKVQAAANDEDAYYATQRDRRVTLRDLLARRLMREKRYDDAFPYFHDDKVRDAAKAYADALKDARHAWGKVDRAEGLFKAATTARQSGMEILGTEGPPDSYYTEGNFEDGLGRDTLKGPYITDREHERFAASNVVPDQRYHYRYVAIGEINAAADLVPAKSQAYAAMLCHAIAWSSRDEGRAKALWQRYVKHGARVPFVKTFGVKCPAPDFSGAITMERKLMVRDARHYVSHHRWTFAGGGAAGLLAIAGLIVFLVRRRKKAA